MSRQKLCDTKAAPEAIAELSLSDADPAKALVMKYLGQLVADGFAQWTLQDNGDVELRLHTGETFLLAKTAIVRLA